MDMFISFLEKRKIKSKKLLALFQRDKKPFLKMQEEGIWILFPEIDGVNYAIKLKKRMKNLMTNGRRFWSMTGSILKSKMEYGYQIQARF